MERKCLRCQSVLQENCHLKFNQGPLLLNHQLIVDNSDYTKSAHQLKCAYCPNCGYVETYFETSPVKKIAPKRVSNSYQQQVIAKSGRRK